MENLNIQTNNLKLNVTNINSFLISSNKKIKKLSLDKKNIIYKETEKKDYASEEKRLELSSFGKGVANISRGVIGKTMGFFDTLKELLGLLILGAVVNNLPKIIKGISDFFENNKWLIDGTKFVLKAIADGIYGIATLIDNFAFSDQKKVTSENSALAKVFADLEKSIDGDIREADKIVKSTEGKNQEPIQKEESIKPLKVEPSESVEPVGSFEPKLPVTPQQASEPKGKKFAEGGKVQSSSISSSNSTKSSVQSKTALQTTNYFSTFRENTKTYKEVSNQNEKNKNTLEEVVATLKVIEEIKKTMPTSPMDSLATRSSDASPSLDYSGINVDPDEVVGKVGSTGRSTGPHIHIETGDGYTGAGGSIPANVLNNIIVGDRPLSRWPAGRGRTPGGHSGFDYPIPTGTPITLSGGLKFKSYTRGYNAGYGNTLIITDSSGNKYLIGHLSAGPTNLDKLREKQAEKARGGPAPKNQQDAYNRIRAAAVAAGSPNPDVTASIAMLESGWLNPNIRSRYNQSGGTNPFGQTGRGTRGSVNGFAVYNSLEEGVAAHVRLWKNYYRGNNALEILKNMRDGGYNREGGGGPWIRKIHGIYTNMRQDTRSSLSPSQRSRVIGEDIDSSSVAMVVQPMVIRQNTVTPIFMPFA